MNYIREIMSQYYFLLFGLTSDRIFILFIFTTRLQIIYLTQLKEKSLVL